MFKLFGKAIRGLVDAGEATGEWVIENVEDVATAITEIPGDIIDGYQEGFNDNEESKTTNSFTAKFAANKPKK